MHHSWVDLQWITWSNSDVENILYFYVSVRGLNSQILIRMKMADLKWQYKMFSTSELRWWFSFFFLHTLEHSGGVVGDVLELLSQRARLCLVNKAGSVISIHLSTNFLNVHTCLGKHDSHLFSLYIFFTGKTTLTSTNKDKRHYTCDILYMHCRIVSDMIQSMHKNIRGKNKHFIASCTAVSLSDYNYQYFLSAIHTTQETTLYCFLSCVFQFSWHVQT